MACWRYVAHCGQCSDGGAWATRQCCGSLSRGKGSGCPVRSSVRRRAAVAGSREPRGTSFDHHTRRAGPSGSSSHGDWRSCGRGPCSRTSNRSSPVTPAAGVPPYLRVVEASAAVGQVQRPLLGAVVEMTPSASAGFGVVATRRWGSWRLTWMPQ
jgi:hypothetical protein